MHVRYPAGRDCLNVDVGVMGDKNESVILTLVPWMVYVRFVVEASKVAPPYLGKETL